MHASSLLLNDRTAIDGLLWNIVPDRFKNDLQFSFVFGLGFVTHNWVMPNWVFGVGFVTWASQT